MAQGMGHVGMRLPRFHNDATHLDELMGHAAVNLEVHRDPGQTQFIGIGQALVDQRVALGQAYPGGRHAIDIGRAQRRKTPVLPVRRAAQILAEEKINVRGLQHKTLAKPPVRVAAVGTQILERIEWDQSTLTHEPQVLGQAAHLWSRTSLRPADVDVAELYDGFTFNCLSWIEALGFCGIGEAKDFLDGGKNIARDGLLPLNTHGGQLSHGRTHGMGLLHEAVSQLRGQAGPRQVEGARVAVTSSGGLTPSGVLLLTSEN